MRKLTCNALTFILILLMAGFPEFAFSDPGEIEKENKKDTLVPDYIIGYGDVLNILVWKNETLSQQVTVLPDGKIAFPLLGEIAAGGKTVSDLRKELENKLQRYVPDPVLSVSVVQVNSMMIYVLGKVNHPGRFNLNSNINVMQALSTAGGLNTFAKSNKIKIFREINGSTKIYGFDYDEVADGESLEQNIRLQRNDVIVVP